MMRVSRDTFAGPGALFAAAVVIGPGLVLWHLHRLWSPDGAYSYGWVVPLLAAFLFKYRWEDRPPPSAPLKGAAFLAGVLALLALPALWLQEAAPERSICTWGCAVAGVGTSLALLSLAGGVAWLRWFGFPFAFVLTAAPWPHGLETLVSNYLMRGTARAAVEVLCLIGIPSVQSGNLVHIETGVIDIDEACSGIRSLQAMVMISLFLGELFRLRPARRLVLIAIGLGVTLLANVFRTIVLSGIGFNRGMAAVDRWHDAAGFAVLLLSLAATLIAAFRLGPAGVRAPAPGRSRVTPALPVALSAALLLWFVIAEVSVETWYRLREPKWRGWSWTVRWPRSAVAFSDIAIPQRSLRLLMCDASQAASWKEPDGGDWSVYWIRWNPGNPAAESAKVHRPDVCLNAEGAIMEKDLGMRVSAVGPLRIPFHSYTFRLGEKRLYVFFCLHEEMPAGSAIDPVPRFEAVGIFERALKGWRDIGGQSLEAALSGYPSEQSAQAAFDARIGQLIEAPKD